MQVADGKTKFTVTEFLNPSISTSWLKHGLKFFNSTSLDFEKSYVVISFKIFSALSWEKELKN
jgi:hypothetical protein